MKKKIWIFLGILVSVMSIHIVQAKTLTINEVADEFNDNSRDIFYSTVNEINKTLDIYIYEDSKKILSLNYTNDYIEYNNRDFVATEENYEEIVYTLVGIGNIMSSILSLSGYADNEIFDLNAYVNNFNDYGIEFEFEDYNFQGSSENDGVADGFVNWDISGEYVKYFKMSFDTDKIDSLMARYGTIIQDSDVDEDKNNEEITKNEGENLVTTISNQQDKNIPENPKTGSFLSITLLGLAAGIGTIIFYITKRKNKIYKI